MAFPKQAGSSAVLHLVKSQFESVGFPVPDTMIKIVDRNSGEKLGALSRGEILVHSPNVMRGYYKNSDASAATLDKEGWLRTGDIGYYDHYGRVFVTGRAKSVIKCLDTKVEPFEVEQCILELQCVAEVAVLGVTHPFFGEAPAAIVVLKQEHLRQQTQQSVYRCLAPCIKNHVAGKT
ncbi:hypothetical protein HPB48_017532 [Haemaphysalis longicornis]|uniref:Uncharacterized protein n=1 Tax=Haemaphysalis longicornis TaxID=44386 RepID=A0A9J6FZQ4_HAELO|nr:hypothetical protein HPB48_017532 [Haemaphysalis longicornis]